VCKELKIILVDLLIEKRKLIFNLYYLINKFNLKKGFGVWGLGFGVWGLGL
jgi:hypothetical protein